MKKRAAVKKQKMFSPFLVENDLAIRIEKAKEKLLSQRPNEKISRANVVRILLTLGCEQVEAGK